MEEKIIKIFEKEYKENTLENFLIQTQKIYEVFGYDFKLTPSEFNSKGSLSGKVWLNKDYTNSAISNLEIITFDMLYPNVMRKIIETNLVNYKEVYNKIILIYQNNKNDKLKKYINMTFGCLSSNNSIIYSKNIDSVLTRLNIMFNDIITEFKGHVIYVDIDQIFFRNFDEIKDRFEKYFNRINKYELTYFSQKSKFGLFTSKKKYLIEENDIIKIKGMKHFNKDGVTRGGLIDITLQKNKINYHGRKNE